MQKIAHKNGIFHTRDATPQPATRPMIRLTFRKSINCSARLLFIFSLCFISNCMLHVYLFFFRVYPPASTVKNKNLHENSDKYSQDDFKAINSNNLVRYIFFFSTFRKSFYVRCILLFIKTIPTLLR